MRLWWLSYDDIEYLKMTYTVILNSPFKWTVSVTRSSVMYTLSLLGCTALIQYRCSELEIRNSFKRKGWTMCDKAKTGSYRNPPCIHHPELPGSHRNTQGGGICLGTFVEQPAFMQQGVPNVWALYVHRCACSTLPRTVDWSQGQPYVWDLLL